MIESGKIILTAEDCVKVDNKLFFLSMDVNIIFSLNIESGEIEIVDSIPEELLSAYRLGIKILYWNGELILLPMSAQKIWRYNISTKEWKGYALLSKKESPSSKFFQGVLYGDELFCIGGSYPAIVSFNLKTERLEYIEGLYGEFLEKRKKLRDCFFRADIVQKDETLYLASCLDNKVVKFHMLDKTYRIVEVGKKGNRYSGIAWDGEKYYLSPRYNTPIVKWDGENFCEEIPLPEVFKKNEFSFLGVTCVDDKKVFPGVFTPYSLELTGDKLVVVDKGYYIYKYVDKDFLVSLDNERNLEIVADGKKTIYKFCLDKKQFVSYVNERFGDVLIETPYRESNMLSISVFLDLIKGQTPMKKYECDNEIGTLIWKEIQ